MQRKLMWRWALIGAVTVAAIFMMVPPSEKIHLGLDLRGGIHLVLQVNTADAVRAEVDDAMERVRGDLAEKGFPPTDIQRLPENNGFRFAPAASTDTKVLDKVIDDRLLEFSVARGAAITATLRPEVVRTVKDLAVRQGLETIRNRIDQFGVAEPIIQRQGIEGDRIVVQLPGIDDPIRVKELIRATAFLEIKTVTGVAPNEAALLAASGGSVPEDSEVVVGDQEDLEGRAIGREYYLLKKASVITGRDLRNARRSQDQYNQPAVAFSLNPDGARKFEAYTSAHLGDRMAIVLDNKVRSAPSIRGVISDSGIIEGNFSIEGAEDLALVLRAGALPAVHHLPRGAHRRPAPRPRFDRSRHACRPRRADRRGDLRARLYYRGAGMNAIVALVLNAVLLIGAMAALRAPR